MKHQHWRMVWIFIFNTCFLQLLYFISLAQQPTGQVAKHYDSETIQCAGAGQDNLYLNLFTAAKTLFWELPYQLRIRFVPGSVPFEESKKHPCVQEMFFSHENKQRIPGWTSRLQECSALVESLVCKHGVVSSAYLRLLIFLPATLIPACASSPAFLMMYSAWS